MGPDDELCLCFHVTRRKVENFIRIEQPRRPGELSNCFGAGTGCGWCRSYLQSLLEQARGKPIDRLPTPQEYAKLRERYVREGRAAPETTPTEESDKT